MMLHLNIGSSKYSIQRPIAKQENSHPSAHKPSQLLGPELGQLASYDL